MPSYSTNQYLHTFFIKKERWGLNIAGGNEGRGVSPPQRSENTQALVGAWIGRLLA